MSWLVEKDPVCLPAFFYSWRRFRLGTTLRHVKVLYLLRDSVPFPIPTTSLSLCMHCHTRAIDVVTAAGMKPVCGESVVCACSVFAPSLWRWVWFTTTLSGSGDLPSAPVLYNDR